MDTAGRLSYSSDPGAGTIWVSFFLFARGFGVSITSLIQNLKVNLARRRIAEYTNISESNEMSALRFTTPREGDGATAFLTNLAGELRDKV